MATMHPAENFKVWMAYWYLVSVSCHCFKEEGRGGGGGAVTLPPPKAGSGARKAPGRSKDRSCTKREEKRMLTDDDGVATWGFEGLQEGGRGRRHPM
jgi:hypothetical protein